jgi:Mor family transcriptional regulator
MNLDRKEVKEMKADYRCRNKNICILALYGIKKAELAKVYRISATRISQIIAKYSRTSVDVRLLNR